MNMDDASSTDSGLTGSWPALGLESVKDCPVCGSVKRTLLHKGLVDKIYFCAPGKWTMYSCGNCGSGYLDPRPNLDTIGLAYQSYYTHEQALPKQSPAKFNLLRRTRRALSNGYTNRRYGGQSQPSIDLGYFLAYLLPALKRRLDLQFRYLPRPVIGANVLDIGCGNGSFLQLAKQSGWRVYGADTDIRAVEQARQNDVEVRQGSIEVFADKEEFFDAVTLSHVIEHLHDPIVALRQIKKLMKPGALLYVDTPNLNSFGHRRFGRHWRGLEPPRHLAVFTLESLREALEKAEFHSIKTIRRAEVAPTLYPVSSMLENGRNPNEGNRPKPGKSAYAASVLGGIFPKRLEFCTVTAIA